MSLQVVIPIDPKRVILNQWEMVDAILEVAQNMVEELRANNDDSQYRLLESAVEHIIAARGDLDADLK